MVDIDAMLSDPRHPSWNGLPNWVTAFRSHQIEAVEQIYAAFHETDTVVLDAPVGSGKSLVAEMTRRLLGQRSVYTCTTKSLQDQLIRDFPHARVLKGRTNYPTQLSPFPEVTSADCTAQYLDDECLFCEVKGACGYTVAKREALMSDTAILNTAYFLTEANGPGRFGAKNARGLVVFDEADELENALLSHVEVEVGPWWRNKLGIGLPQVKTESAKSNDWQEWAEEALAAARGYFMSLPEHGSVKAMRHRKRTANLVGKLDMLVKQLPEGGWVYDGYNRREPTALFKPIMVDTLAPHYLWRHGRKFLLMSGSVISADEMADSLGVEDYAAVTVPVDWDATRRPVHYAPIADVTYRNKDAAYPKIATAARQIVERYPDDRILIHTVSYQLTAAVHEEVEKAGRPTFTYRNAQEREAALEGYKATEGSVLVAPSMDRGIDLKDDLARVMIVCKVPYPSMGDKQVKTRANMGRRGRVWYSVATVRSVIQMLGRGMRHEDDHCVTFILDRQWGKNVMRRSKKLVPRWVRECLDVGAPDWVDAMVEEARNE